MRSNSNISPQKNQLNTKQDNNAETIDTKAVRHTEIKWGNDGSKAPTIRDYSTCKWIKLSNQKTKTAKGTKTQDAATWHLQETHLRSTDTNRVK